MINKKEYIKITFMVRGLIEESKTASPPRLAEIRLELTVLSANLSEALDDILVFKADQLEAFRTELGSSAAASSKFKSLIEGKQEIYLRGWLLRIKDTKSAIRTRLDIYRDQNYNQF